METDSQNVRIEYGGMNWVATVFIGMNAVALSSDQESKLTEVLTKYQKVKQEDTLLMIPFTTVFDYMFYLRDLSHLLEPLGSRAMIYLAAAVSDFYIHPSNMVPEFLDLLILC